MKTLKLALLLALTLLPSSHAQEMRFFRVVGPTESTITGITADGHITWTNVPANGTFTIQTAQSLLSETNWIDYVHVSVIDPVTTHNFYAFMVLIPAGSFAMGNCMDPETEDGGPDELPLHTNYVSAFYMDQYEVTMALWNDARQWATNHGYDFDNPGTWRDNDNNVDGQHYPVHRINWYDMVKCCNARSEKEGLTPCYYTDAEQTTIYKTGQLDLTNGCVKWDANGYRLPTEAEWEKAARGGDDGHRFPWAGSDTISWARANYYARPSSAGGIPYDVNPTEGWNTNLYDDFHYTNPVEYFPPNGYGLHDMAGNVWECCWDWYDANWYTNAAATQCDTRGPNEVLSSRVRRGGSWDGDASVARCSARAFGSPWAAVNTLGFRCVRGP
jgi:formylglycine-generating enzyme required for sulfatase activity